MVFDDSAARTTAIPTPTEGMVTYLKDNNQVQAFTGAAFSPVGRVVQLVDEVLESTHNTTSTSFVSTGLTATITPTSSSSKILVFLSVGSQESSASNAVGYNQIYRGDVATGVALGNPTNGVGRQRAAIANDNWFGAAHVYDSPEITSSVTYTHAVRVSSGTLFTLAHNTRLTLIEVAD